MNVPLISSILAILVTQVIKYPLAFIFNRHRANLSIITATGGMPSSHSAAVSSLVTALILEYGFNSPLVAIATVFGVIVMFDSMGVRRQSGEQGIILDKLARKDLDDLQRSNANDPFSKRYEEMIIRKYLGHKPSEVIVGVITGALVAILSRLMLV
ncbi:divergent PAP2 family protein [Hutsoniella sourekii]|uniref:divergent PAP2 family protein n=1 Tax=Hutsoniella sourekii TaxID=87650 RepID=UPI0004829B92|nr:divergent PAP2 family protein [Hutsoniella sourekii]